MYFAYLLHVLLKIPLRVCTLNLCFRAPGSLPLTHTKGAAAPGLDSTSPPVFVPSVTRGLVTESPPLDDDDGVRRSRVALT